MEGEITHKHCEQEPRLQDLGVLPLLSTSVLQESHPPNSLLNKTPKSAAKVPGVVTEIFNTGNGREKSPKNRSWEEEGRNDGEARLWRTELDHERWN